MYELNNHIYHKHKNGLINHVSVGVKKQKRCEKEVNFVQLYTVQLQHFKNNFYKTVHYYILEKRELCTE